jgi:plasmid stabilization system protein ParE
LANLYDEKHAATSESAATWFNGLEDAILSLGQHPRRCPIAPEGKKVGHPLRHLLFGNKPHIYGVIYEINEIQKLVRVLTIRHGAMEPMEIS